MATDANRAVERGNARDRILEAAAAVAHEAGGAHLSLDAVAERAGISKGGLLYHFPTKQALMIAIVSRHLAMIEAAAGLSAEEPSSQDGDSVALSLLRSVCGAAGSGGTNGALGAGVLAALSEGPWLLDPLRDHNRRIVDCLRTSSGDDVGLLAFLVVEGVRFLDLFDANPLSASERSAVLGRLATALRGRSRAA